MKKITFFCFVLLYSVCNAEHPRLTIALEFSEALNIPLVSKSPIWTESFFGSEGIIITNEIIFTKTNSPFPNSVEFTVSSNDNIIAEGTMFEHTSYEAAHNALMLELVCCNMSVKDLVKWIYRPYTNNIGDFCIIRTTIDANSRDRIDEPANIQFVRGAKAIILQGEDDVDMRPIAKMLDALLLTPPINE